MKATTTKEIIVKGTFLHPFAGELEKTVDERIGENVTFKPAGAFIEAQLDGSTFGNVATEGFEIPKLYTATLKGKGPDPKSFFVVVDAAEASEAGGDYAAEKALINFDIVPEWEVDAMIACMEANRVHPTLIRWVLRERVAKAKPGRTPMPKTLYCDENPSRKYSYMNDGIITCLKGEMTFMEGEKSTGKNVFYGTLAWIFCMPSLRIAMSAGMDPDSVFGGKTTDNSAANLLSEELAAAYLTVLTTPKSEVDPETLRKAAEYEVLARRSASMRILQNQGEIRKVEDGLFVLFDEINMAEANFLQSLIHPMADGERVLVLPEGEGAIPLHPHTVLMGGMNPVGSDYTGTRELNSATASRGCWLEFEMPESIEKILRANFTEDTKLGKRHFKACADVYKDFKSAVSQSRVSNRCLNIRGFVRALGDVEQFPEATDLAWRIKVQVVEGCLKEEKLVLDSIVRNKINF